MNLLVDKVTLTWIAAAPEKDTRCGKDPKLIRGLWLCFGVLVSCLNVQRTWFSTRNPVNGTSVNQLLGVCLSHLLTPLSPSLSEHPSLDGVLGAGLFLAFGHQLGSTSHTKFPFN